MSRAHEFTVDDAVSAGRSRAKKIAPVIALFVGVVGAADSAVFAQPEYEFTIVEAFDPNFDLGEVLLWDLNEAGLVSGTSTDDSYYSGFSWDEDTDKARLPIVWAWGLNNLGLYVGDNVVHELLNNESVFLSGYDDWYGTPVLSDINDGGVAVGYYQGRGSNSDQTNQIVLIWDEINGGRTIDLPAAKELIRLNEHGVAVGNIRWSAGDSEAFVYDINTNASVNLHDLLSPNGLGTSTAHDVNENGQVLGDGWNGSAHQAFVWTDADGFVFLPGLNGGEAMRVQPERINNHGAVVGTAPDGGFNWRAFIWDESNGMRDLNTLVDGLGNFILDRGTAINDAGWIIGFGHEGPGWGPTRGFVLKPLGGLALDQTALVRGQETTLSVIGAMEGDDVYFLYSLRGTGAGRCVGYFGGLCLDLLDPVHLIGNAQAGADGTAVVQATVPNNAPLIAVHTQAVARRGNGGADSFKSNTISERIQ